MGKRFGSGCWAVLILCAAALPAASVGQEGEEGYRPSAAGLEAREWFQDAKFGMFIHWGVYSVPARGEWLMENEGYSIRDYEKFSGEFDPVRFSAREIVSLAKVAGMKYITVTSKHHDGFAMFATKQTHWNVVNATPYREDPLKELADEAHRQGIKLFFYYSLMDWHHPDYFPLGRYGHAAGRPPVGDFGRYIGFMKAQLTELLSNYGQVGGIWFDGMWDKPTADWHLGEIYSLIHRLQPGALIGNNHHQVPFPGEDFQIFEKDLPGSNTAGFNQTEVSVLPLETCETINDSWGYNAKDDAFKSPQDLIRYLVRAAGENANLLLNIGPTGSGAVPAEMKEDLQIVGRWLRKHGESIYGTRGGPVSPRSWGVTTERGERVYIHVLEWKDPVLVVPVIPGVRRAFYFEDGRSLSIRRIGHEILIRVPEDDANQIDRIIVLQK